MIDVVEIAQARKAMLAAEIGRLDNFILMAEALVNQSRAESKRAVGDESAGFDISAGSPA